MHGKQCLPIISAQSILDNKTRKLKPAKKIKRNDLFHWISTPTPNLIGFVKKKKSNSLFYQSYTAILSLVMISASLRNLTFILPSIHTKMCHEISVFK